MDRASIIVGPAQWSRHTTPAAANYFYTRTPSQITFGIERFPIDGQATGHIDDRFLYSTVEASIQPDGRLNTTLVGVFWPYMNITATEAKMKPGYSLFGALAVPADAAAADISTICTAADGESHTILNTAITKMPDLILGTNKDMVGSMTVTGICAKGKTPGVAASLYAAVAPGVAAKVPEITAFAASDFKQGIYTATVTGVGAMATIEAQDGWTASFEMSTTPIIIGGVLRDIRFQSLRVMVRGTPANATAAEIIAALGLPTAIATGVLPGASQVGRGSSALVVSGGGVTLTVPSVSLVSGGFRFGNSELRQDEIGWVSNRVITAGVVQEVCNITVA